MANSNTNNGGESGGITVQPGNPPPASQNQLPSKPATLTLGMVPRASLRYYIDMSAEPGFVTFNHDDLREDILYGVTTDVSEKTHDPILGNEIGIRKGLRKVSLHDGLGFPSHLSPTNLDPSNESQGADRTHLSTAREKNPSIGAYFGTYSNSGRQPIETFLRKGKVQDPHPGQTQNGNEFLIGIQSSSVDPIFSKKISSILTQNRFNDNARFVDSFSDPNGHIAETQVPALSIQSEKGRYDKNSHMVTIENLKKVGLLTLMRATGEVADPSDPNGAEAIASAFTLGTSRVGVGASLKAMSARRAIKKTDPLYPNESRDSQFVESNDILSYGSFNNHLVKFSGISSAAYVVLSVALVTSLRLLINGISLLMQGLNILQGTSNSATSGEGSSSEGLINWNLYGTFNPYSLCVNKGLEIFFGFNGTSLKLVAQSPGYYITLVRDIIRNSSDLVSLVQGTASASTGGNESVRSGASESSVGVSDPIAIVQQLLDSRIVKFMNTMARIGDIFLQNSSAVSDTSAGSSSASLIDSLVEQTISDSVLDSANVVNPMLHVRKSKFKNPTNFPGKLAWANSTTVSAYLLPGQVINASYQFHTTDSARVSTVSKSPSNIIKNTNRIDPEDVKKIEGILDSEYVPFYFHDLRTNEIISFHAFMDNITDSYSVDYDSTEAYGRIGKVHVYKNTNRSISLGFNIVSTNPEDFDEMWWKINKLVTLVYPQWSEGRAISHAEKKFIQPFSQTPTSSPVIRLRLGDVFTSNYSKFGLARLFGMGGDNFALSDNHPHSDQDLETRRAAERARIMDRMRNESSKDGGYAHGEKAIVIANANATSAASPSSRAHPRRNATSHGDAQPHVSVVNGRGQFQEITGFDETTGVAILARDAAGHVIAPINQNSLTGEVSIEFKSNLRDGSRSYGVKKVSGDGRMFLVSSANLRPSDEEVTRLVNINVPSSNRSEDTTVSAFFNDGSNVGVSTSGNGTPGGGGSNAIVRSFKTTQGKGLAGVITSLGFDWKEATWETEEYGSRAPKYCKVSINFEPIFDIAPGIDSNGFNRAPVYSVGNLSRQINNDNESDGGKDQFNRNKVSVYNNGNTNRNGR